MTINLTQHKCTKEQSELGVIDLPEFFRKRLVALLTFEELPTCEVIKKRVNSIYDLIIEFTLSNPSPISDEAEKTIISKDDNGYLIDEEEFKKLGITFMVGGAPFLMTPLVDELKNIGEVVYAFSKREVVEEIQEDGSVKKTAIFKHAGFVPAC